MYYIGLSKDGTWLYINSGDETYQANDDVRRGTLPPNLTTARDGLRTAESESGFIRVFKLDLTTAQLKAKCANEGLRFRSSTTLFEKVKGSFLPVLVVSGLGAWKGGVVLSLLGALISLWWTWGGDHTFSAWTLGNLFRESKRNYREWQCYDRNKNTVDQAVADKFNAKVRRNWARYYSLKSIEQLDTLSGVEFEVAVSMLYQQRGYTVKLTQASGDFGVDIIARKGAEKLAIQAKRYQGSVGVKAVQEVATGARFHEATKAVVITNSFYTPNAKKLAEKLDVYLVNRKRLATMWAKVYPSGSAPEFNLEKYLKEEKRILSVLAKADYAARTSKAKRYSRR